MKRYKYTITKFSISPDSEDEVVAKHMSKTASQAWLHDMAENLDIREKRKMLECFYDSHINDHKWSSHIVNFLLKAGINDKFLQSIKKPLYIGKHFYTIIAEEPDKNK